MLSANLQDARMHAIVFNTPLQPRGYVWWYIDGLSDDGRHAITTIVFVGSVFSPFYFNSRDRLATPYDHSAMHVALYGAGRGTWAFTEYRHRMLECQTHSIDTGRNRICWDGQTLNCHIDEKAAPVPFPIRGAVHLYPDTATTLSLALDSQAQHWWQPLVPRARIEVMMKNPPLRWAGTGYLDAHYGMSPLDEGMRSWSWLRAQRTSGTTVIYEVAATGESPQVRALTISHSGKLHPFGPPARVSLPKTRWRINRETHADFGFTPRVTATLEDGPFYARSVLDTKICGERLKAMHESLSLERFRKQWVRTLLPFRMRRARG
jgi:carotenoid 1,2-hydratase